MQTAAPTGAWQALRERAAATLAGYGRRRRQLSPPTHESSARGSFQWALVFELEADADGALAWLERANALQENNYWSLVYIGYYHNKSGQVSRALEDYKAAVALRPLLPWARCDRALIYQSLGEWDLALIDLKRALESPDGANFLDLRLTLGAVKQQLGDEAGARAAYEGVIASKAHGSVLRGARINLASLDSDTGFPDRAWAEYNSLLDENPRDVDARRGRALLALRSRQFPRRVRFDHLARRRPRAGRKAAGPARNRSDGSWQIGACGGRRRRCLPQKANPEPRTVVAAYTRRTPSGRRTELGQGPR